MEQNPLIVCNGTGFGVIPKKVQAQDRWEPSVVRQREEVVRADIGLPKPQR